MLRICSTCKEEKDLELFVKNKSKCLGYSYECKICNNIRVKEWIKNNPERKKEHSKKATKAYRDKHKDTPEWKEKRRNEQLKHKFSLLPEDVKNLLLIQQNKCAICYEEFTKTPHIDHCHKTEKIRGLLCSNCNTAIDLFKENSEVMQRAVYYIVMHN